MAPQIIIDKANETFLRLHASQDVLREVKKWFECFAEGYEHSPRYRARQWNGKVSLFKLTDKLLPIGLFNRFREKAVESKIGYDFNFDPSNMGMKHPDGFYDRFYREIFSSDSMYPRDYQNHAVRSAVEKKRGIIEHATGSGKSMVIYCIIRYLLGMDRKIVLIVPNVHLVEQMKKEFRLYGWKDVDDYVTLMYQRHIPDETKPILISTYHSLGRKDDSFISKYTAVLVDEAHQAKAKTIKEILSKLIYADYRLGLTATLPYEDDPKELIRILTVDGFLGPIISKKPAKQLIKEGVLSKVSIVNIIIKYPESIIKCFRYRPFAEQQDLIKRARARMDVFDLIFKYTTTTENTLILCEHLDHLDRIYGYVKALCGDEFEVVKISGKIPLKKRLEIQENAEQNGGMVICATFGTMSTGVNIKRLHQIISASSYKAKIKVLQSLGRGMRKHEEKDQLIWWDLVDDMRWRKRTGRIGENYAFQQFKERIKHYKRQGHGFENRTFELDWKGLYE